MIWNLKQFGNRTALLDDNGKAITYNQLSDETSALAKKIGHRCLVFVLCRNTIGSVLGYVSFVNNGIVALLLNSNFDDTLLSKLIDTYRPLYLWIPISKTAHFVNYIKEYETFDYALLKTNFSDCSLYNELALLLTTSGSTGSPKFVRQSYANVLSNAEAIVDYLNIDSNERPVTLLPMYYTFGLSVINSHLLVGATLLITDKTLMHSELWKFIKEAKATSLSGVPYTYEMLDRLRFYRMDLPSLRTLTQAGGRLSPKLHEKFSQYAADSGRKFVVMYGQCEATARMSYLPSERSCEKIGSIGIAIPGGCFHLIDADGSVIDEPDADGELIYNGPNVTLGYAECIDDLAKGDERNGVLATGDIARFDSDGFYYIVGRKKRFLKIFGNRVNLDEVDSLVYGEFGIDMASAGVDDHLYIFVTLEKYAEQVRSFVIDKTKLNPAAFKIKVIDRIPKNESGKTLYSELSKYFE